MEKLILIFAILVHSTGIAQIELDINVNGELLYPVQISNASIKYIGYHYDSLGNQLSDKFFLFNPDGSLYKEIPLPTMPPNFYLGFNIIYPSTTLFDNDSSTMEFMIYFYCSKIGGNPYPQVRIAREDKTILLDEPYAQIYGPDLYLSRIFQIGNKTKMILTYQDPENPGNYWTKVFKLFGKLPNGINEEQQFTQNQPLLFPNPNKGSFSIKVHSKKGEASIIELFSMDGKLIKTYKSMGNEIEINNPELPNGLYLISTQSRNQKSINRMIIEK